LRTISRSLDHKPPGELAFHRHMFLNIPILADYRLFIRSGQESGSCQTPANTTKYLSGQPVNSKRCPE
jgi:hypothetical protein